MQIAVRAEYPDKEPSRWVDVLKQYQTIGNVELSFYLPEPFLQTVHIEDVVVPVRTLDFSVSSVHMAHARITEPAVFISVLEKTIKIAKELNCNLIVAHPSRGRLVDVRDFITQEVDPLLAKNQVYLCWETFSGRFRFLSGIEEIVNFCQDEKRHRACYDFSHTQNEQEKILGDIETYLPWIEVFHVSNRIISQRLQHLPIFYKSPEGHKLDLDFLQIFEFLKNKHFGGNVTLEYLPQFQQFLGPDAQYLSEEFCD